MVLKAILSKDEVGKLPEAVRAEYVPMDDGRYRLDVHEVVTENEHYALQDIKGLKRTLEKLTGSNRTLEAEVSEMRKLGVPIETITDALEKVGKIKDMVPKEQADALRKAITEEITGQYEGKDGKLTATQAKLERMTKAVEKLTVKDGLRSALVKAGVEEDALDIAVEYASRFVKPEAVGEEYKPRVYSSTGEPRLVVKDGKAHDMGLEDLAAELKGTPGPDRFFKGTGMSGSGVRPGAAAGRAGAGAGRYVLTESQARDFQQYEAMANQMAKDGVPASKLEITPG